jgi:hypothetical protein
MRGFHVMRMSRGFHVRRMSCGEDGLAKYMYIVRERDWDAVLAV